MKYIVAIIQPGRLTAVHEALVGIGIEGLAGVRATDARRAKRNIRCRIYCAFLPKVGKIAVDAKMADKVVEAIKAASESGNW